MTRKSEYAALSNDSDLRRSAAEEAERFAGEETQFQLGHLPTEQPHPYTEQFGTLAQANPAEGVGLLLKVDADIPSVARRIFLGPEYSALVSAFDKVVNCEERICFSGCGSTGRLSMMLEEMWRQYWEDKAGVAPGDAARKEESPDPFLRKANQAVSVMTGGDRALIRAVENFEDYAGYGARQIADLDMAEGDVLVAISEGGETSSVIGTVEEALRRGCEVFFVYNNPSTLLAESIERSRRIIEDSRVTVLDLFTGSMALTGSTRMQATTMEMLVVGTALEESLLRYEGVPSGNNRRISRADCFAALISSLGDRKNLESMGALAKREASIYERGGRVTYFASRFLLDIFSDTTERSPTFMLPPLRPADDSTAPVSWVFAKDPTRPSGQAWFDMLRRAPRGIDWDARDYRKMGAPAALIDELPSLGVDEIDRYTIGSEPDLSRTEVDPCLILTVLVGDAIGAPDDTEVLRIGPTSDETRRSSGNGGYSILLDLKESPIMLWHHLAVKLVMNTISTASMGIMGRIRGNWMVQLDPTNKKLIDRGSRIISHLSHVDYSTACYELFLSILAREKHRAGGGHSTTSPVVDALNRLGN